MKLMWVIKVQGTKCLFEHFKDAWHDFKTHDPTYRLIYPKLITLDKWVNMSDFSGW